MMEQFKPPGPVTRALMSLDLEWARSFSDHATNLSDDELLEAMHKARYDRHELPMQVRQESAQWLIERGLDGLHGEPIRMPSH